MISNAQHGEELYSATLCGWGTLHQVAVFLTSRQKLMMYRSYQAMGYIMFYDIYYYSCLHLGLVITPYKKTYLAGKKLPLSPLISRTRLLSSKIL